MILLIVAVVLAPMALYLQIREIQSGEGTLFNLLLLIVNSMVLGAALTTISLCLT